MSPARQSAARLELEYHDDMTHGEQFDFNEIGRCLWPSLVILKADRANAHAESILAEVAGRLRAIRARMEDESFPDGFGSPMSTGKVINWLYGVWLELISQESQSRPETRRALIHRVLASRLPSEHQSHLLTAVDYLSRLAEARLLARSVTGTRKAGTPAIISNAMQAAYRKLAGLACTSLPIWLAGETGTELDWMAFLVHSIGGAGKTDFHVRDFSRREVDWASFGIVNEWGGGDRNTTLVVRRADRAPRHVQQQIHDHLVGHLAGAYDTRIIVTSEPINITDGTEKELHLDLFAFLYPSMIHVPPLRNRIEDIGPLMSFHAAKRNALDPVPRMTADTLKALHGYHWPRNVQELETVTRFILERKPAGEIRVADLPEGVLQTQVVPDRVLETLGEIHRNEGFRVLSSESKRWEMARFLTEPHGTSFGALDFMKAFNQGRETSRRILALFVSHGLVEPVKGATQKRTIRYRRVALSGTTADEP